MPPGIPVLGPLSFQAPFRLARQEPERAYQVSTGVVTQSSDDATEQTGGTVETTPTSLQNNDNNEWIGIRFQGVQIPKDATIVTALLLLCVQADKNDAEGSWFCEDVDDSTTFTTTAFDLSGRARTTASVSWTTNDLGSNGQIISTPNLASCVQEVIERPGWASGNDLSFLYGHTSAAEFVQFASFDSTTDPEPALFIEWVPAPAPPPIDITADPATLALSGVDASLSGSGAVAITADAATLALPGVDASLAGSGAVSLVADPAILQLLGTTLGLSGTGAAQIAADPAVLVLAGVDAVLSAGSLGPIFIELDPAILSFQGQEIVVDAGPYAAVAWHGAGGRWVAIARRQTT